MTDQTTHDEQFFEPIKEHRGQYFVEYNPPGSGMAFAMLSLVFVAPVEPSRAAASLEEEARRWLSRYPVPLMASSFDDKENVIPVHSDSSDNSLFAWPVPGVGGIALSCKAADLDAFLRANTTPLNLREIYADIPFRTKAEVRADADKYVLERRRQNFFLKCLFVLWLAIIPAGVALFEYFGPEWLGVVVLVISLWQAWRTWLKIAGWSTPSLAETGSEEKERKLRHYYYHCERNPHTFAILKAENLTEILRRKVRDEAARLAELKEHTGDPPAAA